MTGLPDVVPAVSGGSLALVVYCDRCPNNPHEVFPVVEFGEVLGHVAWRAPVLLLQLFTGLALCAAAIHGGWLLSDRFIVLLRRYGFWRACGWWLRRTWASLRRDAFIDIGKTASALFVIGVVAGLVVGAGVFGGLLLGNATELLATSSESVEPGKAINKVLIGFIAAFLIGPATWFAGSHRLAGRGAVAAEPLGLRAVFAEPRLGVRSRLPRVRRVLTFRFLRTAALTGSVATFLYIITSSNDVKPLGSDDNDPRTLLVFVTGGVTTMALYFGITFALRRLYLRSQLLHLIDGCLGNDERYREARTKIRDASRANLPGNRRKSLRAVVRLLPVYARGLDLLSPTDSYSPRATLLWGLHRNLLDHLSDLDSLRPELPDDMDRLLRDVLVLVAEPRSWETYRELADAYGITVDRASAEEVRPSRPGRVGVIYGNVVSHMEQANRAVVAVTVVAVIVAVLVLLLLGQLTAKDGLTLLR